jgi:F0F1-type ATP synthase membrane subunit b/b'
MEQRKEYYNKLDKDANDKLNEAKELEITYEKRIADIEKLIEERKASAAQEAKLEAKAILKDAEKKAEKILLDAQQAAQQERAKILEDTQEEITQMAISAVEKLLAQSSSGALNQFLDAVKKE